MSEVIHVEVHGQAGEDNSAYASAPDRTGVTASGRVVRGTGQLDTGKGLAVAERLTEAERPTCAGATSVGPPNSDGADEATARRTPLCHRHVQTIPTDGDNLPTANGPTTANAPRHAATNAGEALLSVSESLASFRAKHHPSMPIDADKLTPDACARLQADLTSGTSGGQTPPHAPQGEDEQPDLIGEVIVRFLGERAAALAAVDDLQLDSAARRAIAEQVVHDDIPVALVRPFGNAYLQIKEHLEHLGAPTPGVTLHDTVQSIRWAMTEAFNEAGLEVNHETRHRARKMFWRFMLAPGNPSQTQAILHQLQPSGSPLRALIEASIWYCNEHQHSPTAQQSLRSGHRSPRTAQHPPRSAHTPSAQPSTVPPRSVQHRHRLFVHRVLACGGAERED